MAHRGLLALVCVAVLAAVVSAQDGGGGGSYGKQPDGYFQYVNVPGHKEYEFGWNRGNPHHYISRYEQAKDHRFRTRVKWADTKGGYGEHYWEYNHAPKGYGKGHDDKGYGKEEPKGYAPPSYEPPSYKPPSYEPPSYEQPSYAPPPPSYS